MSGPYRGHDDAPRPAARTEGLVADMVRQFADPYAFLRELVQNGLDAGASALHVAVELWPDDVAVTRVADDGCGMTPEVIEARLLTLFSSGKEGDRTKIGKYGVGFVSVLALDPDEVRVETWREGRACRVRITPDHRYTVEEAPPRAGSGTVVELHGRVPRDAFAAHAARCRLSLRRWCRHAARPIHLVVTDHERAAAPVEERIDLPLGVRAAASVTVTHGDETFLLGPAAGAELLPGARGGDEIDQAERAPGFAGFYNRGLTLFETTTVAFPGLDGLRFKVLSPHLSHTLSRDDVRRDEAFARALDRVREIARRPLRDAVRQRLAEVAREAGRGPEHAATYAAVLAAALAPPVVLPTRELTFPLTDPVRGASTATDLRAPPLLAAAPDALTAALAEAGRPVVRCDHHALAAMVKQAFPDDVVPTASAAFRLVRELPPEGADAGLAAEVGRALAAAGHELAGVSFFAGGGERLALAAPGPGVHAVADLAAWWRRFRAGHRLFLDGDAIGVRAARAFATRDPRAAGHLLARALLVDGRAPLAARDNARLLGSVR